MSQPATIGASNADSLARDTTACPGCGGSQLVDFFEHFQAPAQVGMLASTADQARRAPQGDILLAYCLQCGLVHNRRFILQPGLFDTGYEVALHHSPMFCAYLDEVADRLIQRYQLQGKRILEIGCGDGYFLRLLCRRAGSTGIGFDITVPYEGEEQVGEGRVTWVRDYLSDRYAHLEADFVCCLSVFEAILQPREFLQKLRAMLQPHNPPMYFEVFHAFRAFAEREIWSVIYEQCNYFGLESFQDLFRRSGFNVLDGGPCYQAGQYIYVEVQPELGGVPHAAARLPESPKSGCSTGLPTRDFHTRVGRPVLQEILGADAQDQLPPAGELPVEIAGFADHHRRQLELWSRRLAEYEQQRKRAVLWGSGGKGITFLNSVDTAGRVQLVVDINPNRQGKYIPVTAHKIVAPDSLRQYRPDVIIITNRLYEPEIRRCAADMQLNCEFVHA